MRNYLHLIDVNTEGPRYDVTPLFADFESFSALVEDLLAQFNTDKIDYVAGIDALGFILGTAISFRNIIRPFCGLLWAGEVT
jgi:adenine phosphoribosyltransferase